MRILLLTTAILFSNTVIAAECLSVSEETLDEKRTDYGLTTAEWSAKVHNKCEAAYDGTLRIRFMDSDDQLLHTTTDVIILLPNESKESRRAVTIPVESLSEISHTDIEIRERERPF